jgi:hypothetical protein
MVTPRVLSQEEREKLLAREIAEYKRDPAWWMEIANRFKKKSPKVYREAIRELKKLGWRVKYMEEGQIHGQKKKARRQRAAGVHSDGTGSTPVGNGHSEPGQEGCGGAGSGDQAAKGTP